MMCSLQTPSGRARSRRRRRWPIGGSPTSVAGWRIVPSLAVAGIISTAACDSRPLSMGDVNAIVVTAAPELWSGIGSEVLDRLEGSVFTVRDERAFRVSYQDPSDSVWLRLRVLKQQLVIGTASNPWVAAVLNEIGQPVDAPGIVQVRDVWARGQLVTALVLPEGGIWRGRRDGAGILARTPRDLRRSVPGVGAWQNVCHGPGLGSGSHAAGGARLQLVGARSLRVHPEATRCTSSATTTLTRRT